MTKLSNTKEVQVMVSSWFWTPRAIKNCIKKTYRFRTFRALGAPKFISIKNCIKKSIDCGPPELLGALEVPQFISIKNRIQKSIDFGLPELWRLLGALEASQLIAIEKNRIKTSIDLGRPELWVLQV